MTDQIIQKFVDLLGPLTDGRLHFSKYAQKTVAGGHTVCEMSEVQLQLAEQLIKDHFKVSEVLWMKSPTGLTKDGKKTIVAKTHRLADSDYETYEGKTAHVYLILFSPKMYDPSTWVKEPVKDGCTFSPLWFDPLTFTPSRRIILSFNPEVVIDEDRTLEDIRLDLHLQLDKILDNPEDYMPEGYRVCMIRMVVE
jgi:hypothetical protein